MILSISFGNGENRAFFFPVPCKESKKLFTKKPFMYIITMVNYIVKQIHKKVLSAEYSGFPWGAGGPAMGANFDDPDQDG